MRQILLVEDFENFFRVMAKRNEILEKKVLSLMLQSEQANVQKSIAELTDMQVGHWEATQKAGETSSEYESEEDETDDLELAI